LIASTSLARYRANAAALQNHAVFEIPEMLESILEQSCEETPEAADKMPVLAAQSV